MKKNIRKILIALISALGIVILLLGLAIAFIQTGPGQRFIEKTLNETLVRDEGRVSVSGISGRVPFNLAVENISLEDGRGAWLNISHARLKWSFSKLFKWEIHIHELGAGSVDLVRLPDTNDTKPKEDKPDFTLEDIRWTWPLTALTVENLYLQSLHVSDQILDENMEFNLEGRISAHDEGFSLAGLDINRLDKPSSLVSFEARLTRDPYFLDLDLIVTDPGMLETIIPLANWPSAASLRLKGSGPLNSWQGELSLDGQDIFHSALNLEIRQDDFYLLEVGGGIFVNPVLLPAQGLDFTRDTLDIFLKAGLDHSRRIVLENLSIDSSMLDLKAAGIFDLTKMSASGDLSLNIPDINPLLMDSGFKSTGSMNIHVDFEGPVTKIYANSTISLGAVRGHGLSLEQASLASGFKLKPSVDDLYTASGSLEISNFHIEQYTNLPENLEFNFDLDHSFENVLTLNRLDLKARDLGADLSGQMDFGSMKFDADLAAHARDAQQLIPGLTRNAFFSSDLDAVIKGGGDIREFHFFADADLTMPGFHADDPVLSALVGDRPKLAANLTFDEELFLRVSRAWLEAEEFQFTVSGNMGFKDMEMDYTGELVLESLAGLAEALDTDFTGELAIDLSAQGDIAGPDLHALVRLADLRYQDLNPASLEAELSVFIRDGWPLGNVEMFMTQAGKRVDLLTDFAFRENNLEIADFSAWGHGLDISGDLDFDIETSLASGGILADISDLSSLGEFFDLDISGTLKSEINLAKEQADQSLAFSLSAEDLAFQDLYVSGIQASGQMKSLSPQGLFSSELTILGFNAPHTQINTLNAQVKGTMNKMDFSSTLSGKVTHPLDLSMKGGYFTEKGKHGLEISEMSGVFAHKDFYLDSPSTFSYSPDQTSLSPFNLVLGSGLLTAEAALTRDEVKASIALKDLNLMEIPVSHLEHILGVINFDMSLTGSPRNPTIMADINIDGLAPSASQLEIPHPLNFTARMGLENGRASLEASLLKNQTNLAGLDFSLPVDFSINPFHVALPDPVPLSGTLKTSLELETLAMLVLPPDQLLSGTFDSDFTFSGTITEPELKGTVKVENSIYEHMDAGIYIADLELRAEADQTRLTVTEISASDGLRGRVSGSGFIDLAGDIPWNIEMDFKNMRLVNHKLALVFIDNGSIEVLGDSSQAEVSGRIIFGPVNISLPEQSPPGVVDLNVTEINKQQGSETAERPSSNVDYPVSLNLELVFPSRVYVRGRGLDSEWEGALNVNGEAANPSIHGNMNVVRGRLEILDRRFILTPESNINLDGTFPPDPNVDIFAGYRHKDKIINVRVFGPALEPEIKLSSEPHMPEDEIMAWVLFGRDLSSISPFQAITLVNAARKLATGQTGPDMLGQIRDFIGVDDLDITRDPEEGHTQFGLGKYVHERVYIEVKKGTAPGTDEILVDVELTPRISLESNLESGSEGGIGLFWNYDY
jgi:translocation and assembly module TamB